MEKHQRGLSLIEAMVSVLVVCVGMLGLLKIQSDLRSSSENARHSGEALRLVQSTLEAQRGFSTIKPIAGLQSYASISTGSSTVDATGVLHFNTSYAVQRHIDEDAQLPLKYSNVEVSWSDRQGQSHTLELHSMLAGQAPAMSAALSQPGRGNPAWSVRGRSISIPLRARDLGDGRSAYKPISQGGIAWVFDNTSGQITAVCSNIPDAVPHESINAGQLNQCQAVSAWMLSGLVRFSWAKPPTPENANDSPLPLDISLQLNQAPNSTPPICLSESVKVVQFDDGQGLQTEWVKPTATPGEWKLKTWNETGERFISYQCLIFIPTNPSASAWSGHSDIQPQQWSLGVGPGQYRACRYSSDTDGSGAIDKNEEHPAAYTKVHGNLVQQHFLVIHGEQQCPIAAKIKVDGTGLQVYNDWSTMQHQP